MEIKNAVAFVDSVTINTERHGEEREPHASLKLTVNLKQADLKELFGTDSMGNDGLTCELFNASGDANWPQLSPLKIHRVIESLRFKISGPGLDPQAKRVTVKAEGMKAKDFQVTPGTPATHMARVTMKIPSVPCSDAHWALFAHWQQGEVKVSLEQMQGALELDDKS